MTTLTQTITNELLEAMDDPGEMQAVLHKHANSKGPLYIALAKATNTLVTDVTTLLGNRKEAEKKLQEQQQHVEAVTKTLANLQEQVALKTGEQAAQDTKIEERKTLLDRADSLAALGFGADELSQLNAVLTKLAASQGEKKAAVVSLFFQLLGQYQDMISLELEAKSAHVAAAKAKAEMEKCEAETKAAEAKAKARKISLDIVEKMLAQGVKEPDLPHWAAILAKSSVAPGEMAGALEKFGTLDKLCKDREKRSQELHGEAKKLTSQVNALTEERDNIGAAIEAVKDKVLAQLEATAQKAIQGLSGQVNIINVQWQQLATAINVMREKAVNEMKLTSEKARGNIDVLMAETAKYGAVERHAGALEAEVALARAFKSHDPEQWKQISRQVIGGLLAGIILWSHGDPSHNPLLPAPPSSLSSRMYMHTWLSTRLDEILVWALSGVFTEE